MKKLLAIFGMLAILIGMGGYSLGSNSVSATETYHSTEEEAQIFRNAEETLGIINISYDHYTIQYEYFDWQNEWFKSEMTEINDASGNIYCEVFLKFNNVSYETIDMSKGSIAKNKGTCQNYVDNNSQITDKTMLWVSGVTIQATEK